MAKRKSQSGTAGDFQGFAPEGTVPTKRFRTSRLIDRRDFLQSAGASFAALSALAATASLIPSTDPGTPAGRLTYRMNRNWRFNAKRFENDTAANFDDSGFERVTIPHTNLRLPWHSFDEKSYQFISIYRRHFRMPPESQGRHVFVDFEGAMTASVVWLNGYRIGEYKGGYTPFSFELTPHLDWKGDNVLAVELDSRERADIPPFGDQIDYLTFGGIYREVSLRAVRPVYLENIFARPVGVLTSSPGVDVSCFVVQREPQGRVALEVELRDGDRVLAQKEVALKTRETSLEPQEQVVPLRDFGPVHRWALDDPFLYAVAVRIKDRDSILDEDVRRIGFREAQFTEHGFELNGRPLKLRGLNHHQTFPFVGQAMPARAQRRDAEILKKELKCNIVRTSHYPQSRHFLDACDELGLLVFEEIPGWQHIGDAGWQDLALDNVRRMIRRDWNHPSIILWGVRINESRDNHDLYTRTNSLAHSLDPARPTGGVRYFQESEFLEDVFTMNDFGFPLKPPNHPRYLNTEFVGHTYPTKSYDPVERLAEHIRRHARVHNQLASNPAYAGGLGWCAFDYNTHADFGSGDRICYHGVSDIFRLPKPAAEFYRSQCDPAEEIVLEPAFQWSAEGDWSSALATAIVCSNCEHLKFYIESKLVAEVNPDIQNFGHLPHPPFQVKLDDEPWGELRIEGYIAGRTVMEKRYSTMGVDRGFLVSADASSLLADGADTTRVSFKVADEFGNLRRYSTAAIALSVEGPVELIGENPFSLVGGCGAVWLRAKEQAGKAKLSATHPVLGTKTVELAITAAEMERV